MKWLPLDLFLGNAFEIFLTSDVVGYKGVHKRMIKRVSIFTIVLSIAYIIGCQSVCIDQVNQALS